MERVPASRKLFIIDASGAGAVGGAFFDYTLSTQTAIEGMGRDTGSALIAASRADQGTVEFEALGHGALTYSLLRGLEGEAALFGDTITPSMLRAFVEILVPQIVEEHGVDQQPGGFVQGIEFPVGSR